MGTKEQPGALKFLVDEDLPRSTALSLSRKKLG
jgi:hypothetical protein